MKGDDLFSNRENTTKRVEG